MTKTFKSIVEENELKEFKIKNIPILGKIISRREIQQIIKTMLSSSAFKSAIKSVNSNLDDVIADIKTQTKDMDPKIRKEFVNKMRDEIISKLDIQNLV